MGHRINTVILFLCIVLMSINCGQKHDKLESIDIDDEFRANQYLSTQRGRFIDSQGRHIILHGVNLVNKNNAVNYLGEESPEEFTLMRNWGFNCVRLGIIWDGLEPIPGVYDESYLKGLDQRIGWAKKNNIYVLLDMHQDLFSVKYSDGAPDWATLTDGKPHVHTSPVWSDAYHTSRAIQTAFDHFGNNTPARDGVGIQDHYAKAWAHVAKRYVDEPAVIGYDLMNEPFIGSPILEIQALMFLNGAELFAAIDGPGAPTVEELAAKWTTEEGRTEILRRLEDIETYRQVIDVTYPYYAQFEKTKLMSMYKRISDAIRKVDKNHIIFLETSISSNMGVYSGIDLFKD